MTTHATDAALAGCIRSVLRRLPEGGGPIADAFAILRGRLAALEALAPRVGTWLESAAWRCNCDPRTDENPRESAVCRACWTLRPRAEAPSPTRSAAATAAAAGSERVDDASGTHLIDGEFQSDKYPTTPRGKVPLSVKDPTAQDLLWQYAQRRRAVDAEFSADLETALLSAGFQSSAAPSGSEALDLAALRMLAHDCRGHVEAWCNGAGVAVLDRLAQAEARLLLAENAAGCWERKADSRAARIATLEAQLATERGRHEAARVAWEASYAHLVAQLGATRAKMEAAEGGAFPPEYAVRIARLVECWEAEKLTCPEREKAREAGAVT